MDKKLIPPVSYQGGKTRLAKEIVSIILEDNHINPCTQFYDICSGSGAVSLELVNRGIRPSNITMIDIGQYGDFWKSISEDSFDMNVFTDIVDMIPNNRDEIQSFLLKWANEPIDSLCVYKHLLLQAGSFGGKQIWIDDGEWKHSSFRSYWQPTETSKRRSPVNPMQPMPETIVKRVRHIIDAGLDFNVVNEDVYRIFDIIEYPSSNCIFYIDPPYKNTTGYGHTFDWNNFVSKLLNHTLSPVYVSEGYKDSVNAILLNVNNKKGGISGKKHRGKKEEWLNVYKKG